MIVIQAIGPEAKVRKSQDCRGPPNGFKKTDVKWKNEQKGSTGPKHGISGGSRVNLRGKKNASPPMGEGGHRVGGLVLPRWKNRKAHRGLSTEARADIMSHVHRFQAPERTQLNVSISNGKTSPATLHWVQRDTSRALCHNEG